MPRLSHFPSRLGDNRSASGVESRRHDLNLYFKSLSNWYAYPSFMEQFIKVKIPESMLLSETPQAHNYVMTMDQRKSRNLFYTGDKLFSDMSSEHVDAVIDAIYN